MPDLNLECLGYIAVCYKFKCLGYKFFLENVNLLSTLIGTPVPLLDQPYVTNYVEVGVTLTELTSHFPPF